MARSVKVEKEAFDSALRKMIQSGSVPLSKIHANKKKPATVIPAKANR